MIYTHDIIAPAKNAYHYITYRITRDSNQFKNNQWPKMISVKLDGGEGGGVSAW